MKLQPTQADFETVREILRKCVGAANAVTIDQLTAKAGFLHYASDGVSLIPDRRRTELILQLRRRDFGFPVVTCGRGVYVADGPDAINKYFAQMNSRHAAETLTMTAVRDAAKAAGFVQTGPWEFTQPPGTQPELAGISAAPDHQPEDAP